MVRSTLFLLVVAGSGITSGIAGDASHLLPRLQLDEVCQRIEALISSASAVYNIGSIQYQKDISHWASSSTQMAQCSFEPGTAEDVGIALRILGQSRTPFAVEGGGHASNPGFSSTPGVHIAMSRFSDINYNPADQTVMVGAGLIWDDVHAALEPHGVNVVGGRVSGVGVAGFTLGGGYSWLTNQYGLAIDNVQAFELVLPNGTVADVTQDTSPDLFFALKGGLNNFGIVTRFTLNTFPQGEVWGGFAMYGVNALEQVSRATANFAANNGDAKASIIVDYMYLLGQPGVAVLIFYDAPSPPSGIFDEFLATPPLVQDIGTRSYLSLIQSSPSNLTSGSRVIFNTISVTQHTLSFLESIVNETVHWGEHLAPQSATLITYNVEPFLPTLLNHNTTPSAYPPSRVEGFLPLHLFFAWTLPEFDQAFQDAARTSMSTLKAQAIQDGQDDIANFPVYPNYAIFDTPVADLYGANLLRLQDIKRLVDPDNVMGLAGGFKI